jgi:hypothetical protein
MIIHPQTVGVAVGRAKQIVYHASIISHHIMHPQTVAVAGGRGNIRWWAKPADDWTLEEQSQAMRAQLERLLHTHPGAAYGPEGNEPTACC